MRPTEEEVAELMDLGRRLLGRIHVMDGVPGMLMEVQVEGTFPDGTKLVTVHWPVALDRVDLTDALYGSFLPIPDDSAFATNSIDKMWGNATKAHVFNLAKSIARFWKGDYILRPTNTICSQSTGRRDW